MFHGRCGRRVATLSIGVLLSGLPFAAQAQEASPNQGKISFSGGVDYTTEYWFRGIAQENQGIIAQPYANVGVTLFEGEDFGVDATFGTWNSWHWSNPTSAGDDDFWFESDLSAGLNFDLPANFAGSVTYIYLGAPGGGGAFAQEVDFGLSYDDSEWWGGNFSISPSATLAVETEAGSDGLGANGNTGTYLGLGVTPSFAVNPDSAKPITLSVPVTVGLNVSDYYETATGVDDDETYGFTDVGLEASGPLTGQTDYGQWSWSAGVHYIHLGDSAQEIGSADFGTISASDDGSVYFNAGISMTY
jgi:hypothetical protein